jgi:hypothetical protein
LLAVIVLIAYPSTIVLASSETWTGAVSTNWGDSGNWSGAHSVPASGDSLVFATTGSLTMTDNLSGNPSIAGMSFSGNNFPAYEIIIESNPGGNPFTLTGTLADNCEYAVV